jgi:hypothetical protein
VRVGRAWGARLSWAPHRAPPLPCPRPRFSCRWREYKYFIPDREGLDVAAMNAAAALFVGEHDFRNFCRVDVRAGITNFRRRMISSRRRACGGRAQHAAWWGRATRKGLACSTVLVSSAVLA